MSDNEDGASTPTSGVLLAREVDGELQTLVARRPDGRGFLGGFHGFFVGRLREEDARVPLEPEEAYRAPDRAHWGGAARELFEEAGLLPLVGGDVVAWRSDNPVDAPVGDWASFRELVAGGEVDFAEILREADLTVDARRFHPVGEWETPDWADLESKTEFFVVTVGQEEQQGHWDGLVDHLDPEEHEEPAWLAPGEVVDRWRGGDWLMSTPIRLIYQGLAERGRVDDVDLLAPAAERSRAARESIEIVGGVRLLPLSTPTLPPATHTNCYLVGDEGFVVIDPGSDLSREKELLAERVDQLRDEGRVLEAVILTHHHADHIGGVAAMVDRYGVDVWAHAETAERVDPELTVDRLLEDGEVLRPGDDAHHRLEVMHTPGHAPGHLSLHHGATGLMFAGDLVASTGTILIDPPDGHMGTYLASLERVAARGLSALLPAHGQPVTAPFELLDYYLDHRREREAMVLEALQGFDGFVEAGDLVEEVYDDVPAAAWPLATRSLTAHLIHLAERGLAVRRDETFRAVGGHGG